MSAASVITVVVAIVGLAIVLFLLWHVDAFTPRNYFDD